LAVDLWLYAIVMGWGLFGALRGAARQVAKLMALLVSGVIAFLAAPFLAPKLPASLNGIYIPQMTAATLVIYVLCAALLSFLFQTMLRRFSRGDDLHRRRMDRILGLVLGCAVAASVEYIALCTLASYDGYSATSGWRPKVLDTSVAYAWARTNNAFYGRGLERAERLMVALRSTGPVAPQAPVGLAFLEQLPGGSALLENPRFREILASPQLRTALESRDPKQILQRLLEETQRAHERDVERATRQN
jgi:uncharacterized membrane protein required for colicin V production